MNSQRKGALWRRVRSFLHFFILVTFVVTCCFLLFLSTMKNRLTIPLTEIHLQLAAKLTLLNIIILSLLLTIIDAVRRHFAVDLPVRLILEATDQVMKGNFSVRIPEPKNPSAYGFKRIIHNFNAMTAELAGTDTLQRDFIANVSHELKTPLAVIRNYASMLKAADLPPEAREEYAQVISDTSSRLAELITNILKLNRLENQLIFPEAVEFDLSEQLCRSVLMFEEVWEKKNIQIDADIPDGIHVSSDPDLLELVWNNLLSNAMKFTPEGGTVTVTLQIEDSHPVITVADSGCGMTSDEGRRIFEKFYQADSSRASQGNGLGLALVKRVVDITGSAITVQSAPGKGSRFTVHLRNMS